jgi:tRNA (guanine6-N2)-methyltransferase
MIVIARCVHGLEWVCADEIASTLPAVTDLTLGRRDVTFHLPAAEPRLLALRTVDDVFRRVGTVEEVGSTKDALPALGRRLAELDWSAAPPGRRFDVVASLEGRRTYNRYAVEAAAGAALAPVLGGTFLDRGDAGESELTVRLFLRRSTAVAALRLAARPLHRRPYKQDTGPGTLHPPVAAALARIGAPAAGEVVLDPFCGDGTVAIEAALAYPHARMVATDLDPARLAHARANAARAGVPIEFAVADAGEVRPADLILTNPPWNVAVEATGTLAGSLDRFWRAVPGRLCAVTPDGPAGLKAALRTRIRLAGRIAELILVGGTLPPGLAAWRERALAAGVVLEHQTSDGR